MTIFTYFSNVSQHCDGIFVDLEESKVERVPWNKPAKDHKVYKPRFPSCSFFYGLYCQHLRLATPAGA